MITKLRAIKSYVLRAGRITPAQQLALQELWPRYGIELGEQQLDFSSLFPIARPLVLEIGFGMGQSLAEQASAHPEYNFLGIEVHQPGVGSLLHKIKTKELSNIRIICADAVDVLKQMIPDQSLFKIQIFFPDPWPKKRHHKRRLIQPAFVHLLAQKLKPNGMIHLATDWEEYAQQMFAVLSQELALKQCDTTIERPLTKFEQRGKRLGHGVWDWVFEKR